MILKTKVTSSFVHYTETEWNQPLLTSNTGNPDFTVSGSFNLPQPNPTTKAWYAFATSYGYTPSYYIANYGNEYRTSIYLYMQPSIPTRAYGISLCSPILGSASDGGSIYSGSFSGSNDDGATWTTLVTHGKFPQYWYNQPQFQATFMFYNATYYNKYRYIMTSVGTGHTDMISICSFRLLAYQQTSSEYLVPSYICGAFKDNDKYYMVKGE